MIIAISGKIGSGKDTIGQIIQYLISCSKDRPANGIWTFDSFVNTSNWEIKKFAGKLKQIVSILTGISVEDLEKQEVKDRVLGKEWDRHLLKEHWINDEYAQHEQFAYFATNEDMQKYINDMGHTDSTCSQVGKRSLTVRQLLQEIGTEVMRDVIHPNIWANALMCEYTPKVTYQMEILDLSASNLQREKIGKPIHDEYPNWIITDLRFPNELQAIKNKGGITIRVNRNINHCVCVDDNSLDCLIQCDKKQSNHFSETALDLATFDYVIENNGSIEDLIEKVRYILIKEKII